MGPIDVLLAARAHAAGRAQRRTTLRHTHLAEKPFIIVAWQLANEAFSALAVAYGHDPKKMKLEVVSEPRNRVLTIRAFTTVAKEFAPWFASFASRVERVRGTRGGVTEMAADAPQVILPSASTIEMMGRWGRRFAYMSAEGEFAVDPALIEIGKHFQYLSERSRVAGQALVVPLTKLLTTHWTTGQSAMEDANLPALDAWIDPPKGASGFEAASGREDRSVGPLLHPDVENEVFELIGELNGKRRGSTDPKICAPLEAPLRAKLQETFEEAWALVWRCIERERSYAAGDSVLERWSSDRRDYLWHMRWVWNGGRRRARDSVHRAARLRMRLEEAQSKLEAQVAYDDPLVMAGYELAGKALSGVVRAVDADHMEPGKKVRVRRPLVTLEVPHGCRIPIGKELWWAEDPGRVGGEITEIVATKKDGSLVTIKITHGMKSNSLPAVGEPATFATLSQRSGPYLQLPETVPWTHAPAAEAAPQPIEDSSSAAWEEAS